MTMMRRLFVLAGLAAIAASRAPAQERPPLLPARDVAMVYQAQGGAHDGEGRPTQVRVYFGAGRLRIEPAGLRGHIIVDPATGRATLVMSEEHVYLDMPADLLGENWPPGPEVRFARSGSDRVAGLPCTVWTVSAPRGRGGTACITADGVLLRGAGRDPRYGSGSLSAVTVTFAPQPASLFRPPPDYARLDIPRLAPGLALFWPAR